MKKTTIIIVMAVLCLSFEVNAQLFKGRVVDVKDQAPLAGAIIKVQGQKQTALSNDEGNFELNLPSGKHVLHVQYLSYGAKEVVISLPLKAPLLIELTATENTLKEVEINAGYYTVKERERTGSISKISAETIGKQPVSNPLQALQGRVTGLQITQNGGTPGANINVVIRGQNGIETSTNPFYVIDGIPYSSTSLTSGLSVSGTVFGTQGSSPLNDIPPDEIASIEVLKDADATAIYGSRGSNGVILITTKKGKTENAKISLGAHAGFSDLSQKLSMLSTSEYLDMRKAAIEADNTTIKATDYDLNGSWDQNAQTDWQDELLGNVARFDNVSFSITGNDLHNSFLLGGTYQKQGSILSSDFGQQRIGAHLSSSYQNQNKKLNINLYASYSNTSTNWMNQDIYSTVLRIQPNAPSLRNEDGSLNWANSSWINPLRIFENKYSSKNNNLMASTSLTYTPFKDFEAKVVLGYNAQQFSDNSYRPASYNDPALGSTSETSLSDYNNSQLFSWSIEPQASYQKSTNFGKFSIIYGVSFQKQMRKANILRGIGFASDALIENIEAAIALTSRDNNESIYKYSGAYARLNYLLNNKYILNFTGRRDGSSRFGPGRKFANFGAIGGAWIFGDENFFRKNLQFISSGKLRSSYGTTGNDQIGDYEYLDTYTSTIGYNGTTGLRPLRLFNADFGWETNRKFEVAMELAFFKDRVTSSIAYYKNRSTSQLINYPLALSTGFSSIRANLNATIENVGWEFELTSHNLKRNDKSINWTTSVNLTIPRNKLVDFPNLETSSYANKYVIGRPLSIAKLYQLKGVNSSTGLYEFHDFNLDGVITSLDRQQVAERVQRFYGGLNNNIYYKGFELSFFFQFVAQKGNNLRYLFGFMPGRSFNQPLAYQGEYWTKPGDIAQMQRLSSGSLPAATTAFNNYQSSNATVSDASYIRLKNLAVSYSTAKIIKGCNVRIYAQGQNLWTITDYLGIDPETTNSYLPPLRTMVIGFQFNFSK